ncbi:30S ribosomal protein S18 [Gordonia iterans]|uniref:Small ribosomal subunit protein bS18 n=1 Tax=Gordonia iterans TaxID=1004901 RepID=A0A2S0KD10_9ACTN|nr:30S ribosomal protein S18 [Gordonia iterans]AVL99568.1 30S ribosomal protein S18 [Gordonia iterans]
MGTQKKRKAGERKRPARKADSSLTFDYKDTATLRKFLSDRGRIRSRAVTGLSPQQQRQLATAVRNAREMALLPFSTR